MDNPTTLLVAIMYVTIVATGLVNILMTLSDIVGGQRRTDPVHTGWIVLLLITYFSFFWGTTAILDIEGWNFLAFISFIIGPVILLFATNLLLAPSEEEGVATMDENYFKQSGRFFLLMSLVQAWTIGLDVVFKHIGGLTYLAAGVGVVLLVLMVSKNYKLHLAGLIAVTLVVLARIALQIT